MHGSLECAVDSINPEILINPKYAKYAKLDLPPPPAPNPDSENEKKRGKQIVLHDVPNYWWYKRMGKSIINNHDWFTPGILIRKGEEPPDDETIII